MAVRAIKTEPKCKLCRHPQRTEIDGLLELRSNLTRDPVTRKLIWTSPIVLAQLGEWGVENPTEENIKLHWKKHCEKVSGESVEEDNEAALAAIKNLQDGGVHADTDENLRMVGSVWRAQFDAKIAKGEIPAVSTEHMLKAAAELTRRASSETQHQLLTMFAEGMTIAAGKQPKQIEGAEVIDVEAVEEAEVVAA